MEDQKGSTIRVNKDIYGDTRIVLGNAGHVDEKNQLNSFHATLISLITPRKHQIIS